MGDQIARRHALGGKRVVQLEGGKVVPERPVPFQFPLVDQDTHRHGGEGLGGRADGEDRFRGDWEAFLSVAQAETFREDNFSIFYNGNTQTRYFPLIHRLCDKVVETI